MVRPGQTQGFPTATDTNRFRHHTEFRALGRDTNLSSRVGPLYQSQSARGGTREEGGNTTTTTPGRLVCGPMAKTETSPRSWLAPPVVALDAASELRLRLVSSSGVSGNGKSCRVLRQSLLSVHAMQQGPNTRGRSSQANSTAARLMRKHPRQLSGLFSGGHRDN